LSSRVATLEGDLLAVRAQVDSIHTTTRKLQGKVYRGVPLGDTVDAVKPKVDADAVPDSAGNGADIFDKAALYRQAAQLRGRR